MKTIEGSGTMQAPDQVSQAEKGYLSTQQGNKTLSNNTITSSQEICDHEHIPKDYQPNNSQKGKYK
jgi:hypothetical protein